MQCQPTHVILAVSRDVGRTAAHTFQSTHLIWEPELHPLTVKQIIDQKRTITEERSEDRSQKNDQRIDHKTDPYKNDQRTDPYRTIRRAN